MAIYEQLQGVWFAQFQLSFVQQRHLSADQIERGLLIPEIWRFPDFSEWWRWRNLRYRFSSILRRWRSGTGEPLF